MKVTGEVAEMQNSDLSTKKWCDGLEYVHILLSVSIPEDILGDHWTITIGKTVVLENGLGLAV